MLKEMNSLNNENTLDRNTLRLIIEKMTFSELNIIEIDVPFSKSLKFIGDFIGLLKDLNFNIYTWHIIMELNDIESSDDFDGNIEKIKTLTENGFSKILNY